MNTKRAPKVRFKGFTDAWELRKFESIAARASSISADPTLPRVEYEDIISGIGLLNKDVKLKGISKPGIVFNQGDILYGKLRPYLHNWFLPSFSGLAVGDFWVLQPKDADSSFLFRLIQGQQFDDVANQSIGTKMPRADWNLVSKTLFFVPTSIDEQALIGRYFRSIDNLITLHQRKLDKTKKLRKAFLNLIFSQKLRFRGFDQSWRKLKIEDCFSERVERSEKGELISVTVNFGIVKAHSLDRKDNSSENKSNYKIVRKDDIAYNSMRMWQGASGISLYEGILSPAYTVIIPKQGVSSLFFSYEFKLKKMLQTFQVNSQGLTSDTWNLKFPLLRNIVVEAPEYEEQEKVGIFFKKLDNLITHHQDKINQLTKLKTTFLKNMFI